jgi:hypothetical protein
MKTYADLTEQVRLLNEKGQQLQHQTEMLTRRLPIARTALETIATVDGSPEILQAAGEALGGLKTLDAQDPNPCLQTWTLKYLPLRLHTLTTRHRTR